MDFDEIDVIVIGGGIAGCVAANRAAELGLRVAVLEKGAEPSYLCNSRMTGGAFHVAFRDIASPPDRLRQGIEALSNGHADSVRVETVAADAGRALRWLQEQGLRFVRGGHWEYCRWVLAPPRRLQAGPDWKGRGGDVMLRTLEHKLIERGGVLVRDCRMTGLLTDGQRCVGVEAVHAGRKITLNAAAVIISDGGFQANRELLARHVGPRADILVQRGGATSMGDGLTAAAALGAALTPLNRFYGHLLSADALTNPQLSPYPFLDGLAASGIVIDRGGRRLTDEGMGGVFVANEIAALPDPLTAIVVFDQAIWEGPGKDQLVPPNPHLLNAGATVHRAGELSALAKSIGVPPDALCQTVETYNAALAKDQAASLAPPRTTVRYRPFPILKPPFYACGVCPGITYTTGGIRIDADSRVLHDNGGVIEGLYAAGAATGGLEGGANAIYIGGLTISTVSALRAAEAIARSNIAA